jgi:alpha-tubulin suppressor-like RCC1 family protein
MPFATVPADAAATSGKAFSWGINDEGQLGNGAEAGRTTPGAVKNLTGVKSVKGGCYHGIALKTDGTVRAWGRNQYGQLGNGTNDQSKVPVKVKNLTDIEAIAAGCLHNLALRQDGSVWAWGSNFYGELGNGTNGAGTESNVPVRVGNLGAGVKGIAAGNEFSLAQMQDGTVQSWGYNANGELGNGTSGVNTSRNTPGPVSSLSNVRAIAADHDGFHGLALLNDGTVRSWGYNAYGQLGDGTSGTGTSKSTPVAVSNLSNVKAIAAGNNHSLALLNDGTVRAWGYNFHGQLGNNNFGPNTNASTPVAVPSLSNVRAISGGTYTSFAILENGTARSWGNNRYGQLGDGTSYSLKYAPGAVKTLTNVKNIDGGRYFTLAVTR